MIFLFLWLALFVLYASLSNKKLFMIWKHSYMFLCSNTVLEKVQGNGSTPIWELVVKTMFWENFHFDSEIDKKLFYSQKSCFGMSLSCSKNFLNRVPFGTLLILHCFWQFWTCCVSFLGQKFKIVKNNVKLEVYQKVHGSKSSLNMKATSQNNFFDCKTIFYGFQSPNENFLKIWFLRPTPIWDPYGSHMGPIWELNHFLALSPELYWNIKTYMNVFKSWKAFY